jgi:hypothetical protein
MRRTLQVLSLRFVVQVGAVAWLMIAGSLLVAIPAVAHHAFTAEYDVTKCSNVTGTLSRFEWQNPHGYFYLDAKDSEGNAATWTFETVSIAWLKRSGTVRRDFIELIGKTVTVRGCLAKNGTKNRAAAETIKTPDGRILRVGADYEGGASN